MRVRKVHGASNRLSFELLTDAGEQIPAVEGFLRHLLARGYSPNTLSAYAHDLLHLFRFLAHRGLHYEDFTPAESLAFLEYLREIPSRARGQRRSPVLANVTDGQPSVHLSPTSVNRILAAVSSFYEYLIVSGQLPNDENPLQKTGDPATARVSERYRPFLGRAGKQSPVRRVLRVRTAQRVPRPLDEEQVAEFLGSLRCLRDRAMFLLMLQGGLRPGEVLNLHLGDIQYGRRRVMVRYRTDHPKGARTKSCQERVVDLHEPEALTAVSEYVMRERPADAEATHVFLIGGKGNKRHEPLSYGALVKLFARRCERLSIRKPWVTPHALRHTHATQMWESGMRELTLQKRLGHASPESTRIYTRISDAAIVEEYLQALGRHEEKARG